MTLLRNAVKCTKCGDVVVSTHVHDFRWCSCKSIFTDGGTDYVHRGGDFISMDDMCVSIDLNFLDDIGPGLGKIYKSIRDLTNDKDETFKIRYIVSVLNKLKRETNEIEKQLVLKFIDYIQKNLKHLNIEEKNAKYCSVTNVGCGADDNPSAYCLTLGGICVFCKKTV